VTTEELLELVLDNRMRGLHTSMPGRVESYDAATQTCDVLPQLKRQTPDGEGGYTVEDLPVLPHVPVCFPRGGGFFLSFPLQKGDFVLVVFSERAIGNWRQKGEASNPGDLRMHSLAGAVAIPGVYPNGDALDDADGTNLVLGKDGTAGAQIEITPTGINLGTGTTDAVVTKKDLQSLYFAINAAACVANDGGAAFKAALLAGLDTAGWTTGTTDGQLGSATTKAKR
jgi:hypothetical protein